jgi:hypothetical protein
MIKTVLNSSLLKIVLILLAIVIMGNLFTSKFVNKNNVDNFETLSEERKKMDDFENKLSEISTEISNLTTAIDNINDRLKRDFFKVKPKKKQSKKSKQSKQSSDVDEDNEDNEDNEDDEDSDDENYEDDEPKSTVEKFAQQYVKGVSNNFVGDYMILQ